MTELTIQSETGHYEADLLDTPDGVKVTFWHCHGADTAERGKIRGLAGTTVIDKPFHVVADHVYKIVYSRQPTHVGFGVRKW